MVADIKPNVDAAIDVCQSIGDHVVAAVDVDAVQIGSGRDGVVVAGWEGPVAPLLCVVYLKNGGD